MNLVKGEIVRNPYESFHTERPPGPMRISFGKGSRPWKLWERACFKVPKGTLCVVIETTVVDDRQWACVLVDGRALWTHSVSLSRVGPRGGWAR